MNDFLIYMIKLSRFPDRWKPTINHLTQNGIHPILFEGIDAVSWKLHTDLSENKFPKFFTSGRIGCFLSHLTLWRHLSYFDNWDKVIIFEDDVRIDGSFQEKFEEVLNQLPENWDIVQLGSLWDVFKPEKQFSKNLLIGKPYCTHAYMFKRRMLDILIEECSVIESYLDIQLKDKVYPNVNHFVVDPPLVKQESLNDLSEYKSLCKDWEFNI